MEWISNFEWYSWSNALGWALIHSLWQGGLIGLGSLIAIRYLAGNNARLRYFIASSAMFLILLAFIVTFCNILSHTVNPDTSKNFTETGYTTIPTFTDNSYRLQIHDLFPWLIRFWVCGIVLFSIRMFLGYWETLRIKKSLAYPLNNKWKGLINNLLQKFEIKKQVVFLESGIVDVPTLIGYFKPVILLPVSTLSGIPGNQLEMIIAHELAHIRRHDYLIKLLQGIIELLFFYHPVIWWLSSVVNTEREYICDDLAVEVCGGSLTLIKALNNMEAIRKNKREFVLAFSGRNGNLLSRIQRVIGHQKGGENSKNKLFASGLFTLIFLSLILFSSMAFPGKTKPNETSANEVAVANGEVLPLSANSSMENFEFLSDTLSKETETKKARKKQKPKRKVRKKGSLKESKKSEPDKVSEKRKVVVVKKLEDLDSTKLKKYILIDVDRDTLKESDYEIHTEIITDTDEVMHTPRKIRINMKGELDSLSHLHWIEKEHLGKHKWIEIEEEALEDAISEIKIIKLDMDKTIHLELEKLSDPGFFKDIQMEVDGAMKAIDFEMENLEHSRDFKDLSKEEQERIRKKLEEAKKKLDSPEFTEKLKQKLEANREAIEKHLREIESGEFQKQLNLQLKGLEEKLENLKKDVKTRKKIIHQHSEKEKNSEE